MNFLDSPSEGASCFLHQQQHSQHKQLQNPFFLRCVWNLLLHYKCYNRVHLAVSSESHALRFSGQNWSQEIRWGRGGYNTWPTCGSPSESIEGQADFSKLLFLNILEDRSNLPPCSVKSIVSVCQNSHKKKICHQNLNQEHYPFIQHKQQKKSIQPDHDTSRTRAKRNSDENIVGYVNNLF